MKRVRPIRIEGDVAYIPLTQGYEAVIDAADVALVEGCNWCAREAYRPDGSVKAVYAHRRLGDTTVKLHRVILSAPNNLVVDHINGDGLDNRRANLRIVTVAENRWNSRAPITSRHGHKNITPKGDKWQAYINANGQRFSLGTFSDQAAAIARAAEARAALQKIGGQND